MEALSEIRSEARSLEKGGKVGGAGFATQKLFTRTTPIPVSAYGASQRQLPGVWLV